MAIVDPLLKVLLPSDPGATRNNLSTAVARRIGPMFGLYDTGSPYARSWAVDVRRVLLKELAQGSPDPEVGEVDDAATGEKKLAPTTVNKFGPDPRAALILEGVNRLLLEYTDGLWEMMRADVEATRRVMGDDFTPHAVLSRALSLWAIAIGELWTSYPVLLSAGIWGRTTQVAGDLDVRADAEGAMPLAPNEYGYKSAREHEIAPMDLAVISAPLRKLAAMRYTSDNTLVVNRQDAQWMDDAAENLVSVLVGVAQEFGNQAGIVWVPPLPLPAERVATAYVVPFQIVREFERRQNIDTDSVATTWRSWSHSPDDLFPIGDEVSVHSVAMFIRAAEVSTEWCARKEFHDDPVSLEDHSSLQHGIARLAKWLISRHAVTGTVPGSDQARDPMRESYENVAIIAELRATACRLRVAGEPVVRTALEDEAKRLVEQLDALVQRIVVRTMPTGPGLAQLSRATSDLFAALKDASVSTDRDVPFWSGVHGKIGEYWTLYRTMQAECGSTGAFNHYLGNSAGYYADVKHAPPGSNKRYMLQHALQLLAQIIPYRQRLARRRADWDNFLFDAYQQASECALRLSEEFFAEGSTSLAADQFEVALNNLREARILRLPAPAQTADVRDSEAARLTEAMKRVNDAFALGIDVDARLAVDDG